MKLLEKISDFIADWLCLFIISVSTVLIKNPDFFSSNQLRWLGVALLVLYGSTILLNVLMHIRDENK